MPIVPAPAEMRARVAEIVLAHRALEGPLLPILHAVQAEWGHVPAETMPLIAHELNLTAAEVHGVRSFYHDFKDAPQGRHVVRLCRAEACQSVGGAGLAEIAMARLGLDWNETAADGSVTLEPVYCLGLCACAPSAMVDGELHGRLTRDSLSALLDGVGT